MQRGLQWALAVGGCAVLGFGTAIQPELPSPIFSRPAPIEISIDQEFELRILPFGGESLELLDKSSPDLGDVAFTLIHPLQESPSSADEVSLLLNAWEWKGDWQQTVRAMAANRIRTENGPAGEATAGEEVLPDDPWDASIAQASVVWAALGIGTAGLLFLKSRAIAPRPAQPRR